MNWENLGFCGSILPKTVLILLKNFLNFRFDAIEKQSIINLFYYKSKSYAYVGFVIEISPFYGMEKI